MSLKDLYHSFIVNNGMQYDDAQSSLIDLLSLYTDHVENQRFIINRFFKKSYVYGVYIWGSVGTGKTFVMDLFFNNLNISKKCRLHFHVFMSTIHNSLNEYRNNHKDSDLQDPIPKIVQNLSKHWKVLCLDELQINNIADAMIIARIFQAFMDHGVTIIITSNRPPSDLFKDGLHRERFMPFINLINEEFDIFQLDHTNDYRLSKILNLDKLYYYPLGKGADLFISNAIESLTGKVALGSTNLRINDNRTLFIPSYNGSIAIFSFSDLCEKPLGHQDYVALSNRFDTIIIRDIPKLSSNSHNEALRFITLIDCLYERRIKLICTAEVEPHSLYKTGKNDFEFQRTVSRLIEMESDSYIKNHRS